MDQILLVLIATGLAALIGLEREMHILRSDDKRDCFGGLRTFAMLWALGAIASLISGSLTILVAGCAFLMITVSYAVSSFKKERISMASEFSAVASFLVGVLTAQGQITVAITVAILFTTILALRNFLHKIAANLELEELFAILKLLIISAIILPILPNSYFPFDQWEVFNPYHIWLMVIFVAGIRFVAFFLSKIVWVKKGLVLTGVIGGIASSTAVTSTLSDESKKNTKVTNLFLVSILLANMLMFFRVALEVFIIHPEMLKHVASPLLVMGWIAGILGLVMFFRKNDKTEVETKAQISQPFSLTEALKFGLFFLFVSAAAKIIPAFWGETGLYATAFFSWLADTDAITLIVAGLVRNGDLLMATGVKAIILAVIVNTLVKVAIIFIFGSRQLFWRALPSFLFIFLAWVMAMFLNSV